MKIVEMKFIVYFLYGLLLYPILVYVAHTYFRIVDLPLIPYHYQIQVFFSFPLLIIFGLFEFFKLKRKALGICLFLIGVCWFLAMLYELYYKSHKCFG